jgi:hypothetical protein
MRGRLWLPRGFARLDIGKLGPPVHIVVPGLGIHVLLSRARRKEAWMAETTVATAVAIACPAGDE